jgi:alanyl-tRNA synthetase
VRRIEARTREGARKRLNEEAHTLAEIAATLHTPVAKVHEHVAALNEERRKLERELNEARRKLAMGGGGGSGAADAVRDVAGVKFYARAISGVEMKDLKSMADEAKQSIGSGVVAIVARAEDGKASVVVAVTDDLVARHSAVDLVRIASATLGGKGGGGRPDMAQAGGPDGAQAEAALAAIEAALRAKAA